MKSSADSSSNGVQISDYEIFCIIGHFSSSICFNAFLYILLTQFSGVIAPFPVYIGILFVYAIITKKVLIDRKSVV